jgi:hypothetical protein
MKINHSVSGLSQVNAAQLARAATGGAEPEKPVGAIRRIDSVRISPELSADDTVDGELTPEAIAAIRQRIQEGAYSSLEVIDAVARRILARGDLDGES